MAKNFSPGWNDPPQISANGLNHCHTGSRGLFSSHNLYQNSLSDLSSGNGCTRGSVLVTSHSAAEITGLGSFAQPLIGSAEGSTRFAASTSSLPPEGSAPALDNDQILATLNNRLNAIPSMNDFCKDAIVKRLDKLREVLIAGSLTDDCRQKLCLLVTELSNNQYVNAYHIQGDLMVDHFSQVSSWIPGVKAIIMEGRKYFQSGACKFA